MNAIRLKAPRVRLDPASYEQLRRQVLHRDGWRCQACGAMSNLEVHHQEFRSHAGDDSEPNLITLCTACHSQAHRGPEFQRCLRRESSASKSDRSERRSCSPARRQATTGCACPASRWREGEVAGTVIR